MARDKSVKMRRCMRVRRRLRKRSEGRPRLSVFRSNRYIYAQLIDDSSGRTLASASSLEGAVESGNGCGVAAAVGKLVADRAVAQGITEVVFDRGPYLYHGRVRALADAAREGGLNF